MDTMDEEIRCSRKISDDYLTYENSVLSGHIENREEKKKHIEEEYNFLLFCRRQPTLSKESIRELDESIEKKKSLLDDICSELELLNHKRKVIAQLMYLKDLDRNDWEGDLVSFYDKSN